jgi:autoinducer 2-degrading protein
VRHSLSICDQRDSGEWSIRIDDYHEVMFTVLVDIQVVADGAEAFLAASRENAAHTRREPGALRFDIVRHEDDPLRFGFIEAYRSKADFTAHQQTEHYRRWRAVADPLMARNRIGTKWLAVDPA